MRSMTTGIRDRSRRRMALRLLAIVNGLALASVLGFVTSAAPPGSLALRFANQPNTTQTGAVIRDGFDSTGDAIRVEIYDPDSGDVVNTNAEVTITLGSNPAGATLTGGGATKASKGVATFSNLRINLDGVYRLRAASSAASSATLSNLFVVADQVTTCSGVNCSFSLSSGGNSYLTDPATGTKGASYIASLNLGGLKVSCDFDPYNYPDSRQPNAVFFDYQDGGVNSVKTVQILIGKRTVQETAENGAAHYRVCFSAPFEFTDIDGNDAPEDPWPNGPSAYFGGTWYTGLLPDCDSTPDPPCVLSWRGSGGDRIGTFVAPGGDPVYR
jgi:hypothetical protein